MTIRSARMVDNNRLTLSVVMPVYNERKTLPEIIRRVKAISRIKEIIIVDDCSSDGTRSLLENYQGDPEIKLILKSRNEGKGAALREGIQAASCDVVIIQDADLEYDPQDYYTVLSPIESGRADVVYGSRFLHGERKVLNFWHSLGNKFLTVMSNIFTDLNLTDMETCYKAFKRDIIQNIILESNRFGFEPEITAKLAKLDCTIYEVGINYYGRSYAEGKKITWRDGISALFHIARFSLQRKTFVKNPAIIQAALVVPFDKTDDTFSPAETVENSVHYAN